ncbi:MAG: 50S ribosomal protein L35 [Alphaproteobacteria bacterium]|nr:50S ribosomal protein L35 [Alphaproteobacteria bacterium]
MPKMKTKSSTKGRFSFTATGKVRMNPAKKRHFLRRRSQKMKRQHRGSEIMANDAARIVKKYMPYR